eukprot:maker-scaffold491_size156641-snap-gene-0.28 protein:Tk05479 transcript:maker-scaffold491_size156641-snap-gene-0.28-mRNA-1 annotation:"hypothetical protein DAPPUDRAFT_304481"
MLAVLQLIRVLNGLLMSLGKGLVDYIANYLENIRERRVFPNVQPGFLMDALPDSAPQEGESFEDIFQDVEKLIMPGITHWQSPYMHAYFPALNSYPSLLGDMLANGFNNLGFTWASSPSCTELEIVTMDWLAKAIGLPDSFVHSKTQSHGGGVIQTTASESTFVCLLAARTEAIRRYQGFFPDASDAEVNSRLVAYCSDQAHSSVEKAGLIGLVKIRYIESDDNFSLQGDKLREAVDFDRKSGLIPFFVSIPDGHGKSEQLWLHVDAAYAGSAFLCEEYRHFMKGIEFADSMAFNPSKWMLVHFDCTAMCMADFFADHFTIQSPCIMYYVVFLIRVKNSHSLHRTFNVEPLYLKHENSGLAIDFMHWQVPLSRRFRALKLWFVLRNYGISGLQNHIRESVKLAKLFEDLVRSDELFEIPAPRHMGLVVFRLRGDNELTEKLLKDLNHTGRIHCVPASLKGKYIIRFTVTSPRTAEADIKRDWNIIQELARHITADSQSGKQRRVKLKGGMAFESSSLECTADFGFNSISDTKAKDSFFGTSLLLANIGPNSPNTPKIINGSYAALFESTEIMDDLNKKFDGMKQDKGNCPKDKPAGCHIFINAHDASELKKSYDLLSGKTHQSQEVQDLLDLLRKCNI